MKIIKPTESQSTQKLAQTKPEPDNSNVTKLIEIELLMDEILTQANENEFLQEKINKIVISDNIGFAPAFIDLKNLYSQLGL